MEAEDPEHGRFRQLTPLLAGGLRSQPLHRVRDPGATDTDRLLRQASVSESELAELRAAGAVE
jgi:hypothetical protein